MDQDRLSSLWLAIEENGGRASSIPPPVSVDGLYAVALYKSTILQTMLVSDLSPQQRFIGGDGQATYVRKRDTTEMNWGPWWHVEAVATP